MSATVFPTKGNLIATKNSLSLAKTGFDLMDRKRNILVREMMNLLDDARSIQKRINSTFAEAYAALQLANITTGDIAASVPSVPVDNGFEILRRSVMGVEIPLIKYHPSERRPEYGLISSTAELDEAYHKFCEVKELCRELAEIENSIYRLAFAIKKTQKRVGALKNIIIPQYEETIGIITDALEEKEREEFIRMKVIKRQKEKQE